ncbi:unnamed protein product [Anisakis simplex]|uniref:Col_cuticle_N domain-containing protein n=1 Tax=Anisakis simplex TaxID=6269 RepID=A0A0M3J188_ANISI|nr:unnamed protein product [Anisakis simplex]
MNERAAASAALFPEAFQLSKLQISCATIGSILFTFGFIIVVLSVVLEYVMLRRDALNAIKMKDDMMVPPRCETKAKELGLTSMSTWKEYFAREEPFHDID